MIWDSNGLKFNWCETQTMSNSSKDSISLAIQLIWKSFDVRFNWHFQLIWNSIALRFNWPAIQLISGSINFRFSYSLNSIDFTFNWFEIHLFWDSIGLSLRFNCFEVWNSIVLQFNFKVHLFWNSVDLRFNWFAIQLICNSIDFNILWFEIQLIPDSIDFKFTWFDFKFNWFQIHLFWNWIDLSFEAQKWMSRVSPRLHQACADCGQSGGRWAGGISVKSRSQRAVLCLTSAHLKPLFSALNKRGSHQLINGHTYAMNWKNGSFTRPLGRFRWFYVYIDSSLCKHICWYHI